VAIVVPDTGEEQVARLLLNMDEASDVEYHLYVNDYEPEASTLLSDFTEASGSGYAFKTVAGVSWTIVQGDPTVATASPLLWLFSGSDLGNTYGYYVTDSTNALLWAERFTDGPYNVTTTSTLTITPKLSIASGLCPEVEPPVEAGDADVIWDESLEMRDKIFPKVLLPADTFHMRDVLVPVPTLPDTVHMRDALGTSSVTATAIKTDTLHLDGDTFRGSAFINKVNRTGTPNTDVLTDAWVDATAINQGVNHGNESPLPISDEAVVQVVTRRAYFRYDLTKFTPFTAPAGSSMVFRIWGDTTTAAGLQTVEARFSNSAATPFTESTLTWTNQPAVGSNPVTKSLGQLLRVSPLVVEYREYVFTLTAAEYSPYLGQFLMIMMSTATVVAVGVLNLASREHVEGGAGGGLKPSLTFEFQR
jgi:hypothetical protein